MERATYRSLLSARSAASRADRSAMPNAAPAQMLIPAAIAVCQHRNRIAHFRRDDLHTGRGRAVRTPAPRWPESGRIGVVRAGRRGRDGGPRGDVSRSCCRGC
jgi:hypothetical protein